MTARLTVNEAHDLAVRALKRAGTSGAAAAAVAEALVAAELDGIASHGLSRLPFYADQVESGKVNGKAEPAVDRPAPAIVRVDAGDGFAFPAIDAGFAHIDDAVRSAGVIALAISRSHHAGAFGYHVERLAHRGLIALGFGNTPAAIAPWGGKRALFGTNPIAFAAPRRTGAPLVLDLSLSVAARGKIMLAAQKGEPIPDGWALDGAGNPTTDAKAALAGTMVAIGGAKGAGLALMVEILAAALTASNFGFEASSFFDAKGPPPRVGQFFFVLDPARFGAETYRSRIDVLIAAMSEEAGVRLPGARRQALRVRLEAEGIPISDALLSDLRRRGGVSGLA
ncbi:MAG: Ldh family oxidoreductase [Alphaproteobacteria bacterium]|nr:Ldh family oxidoreductase [Alphaproteobacteria bacterium]